MQGRGLIFAGKFLSYSKFVSGWTREGGGQPNADRCGQGGRARQKSLKLCGHPLWMTPCVKIDSMIFECFVTKKYAVIITVDDKCDLSLTYNCGTIIRTYCSSH